MSLLNLGINARLLSDPSMRGWNRYTLNVVESMAKTGKVRIALFSDHPLATCHEKRLESLIKSGVIRLVVSGPMFYPFWQEIWLPNRLKAERIELFHSPYHFGLPVRSPCPTAVTLHDAIDFLDAKKHQSLNPKSLMSQFYLWQTRKQADLVITVSSYSAKVITKHLGIAEQRIRVIHEAADPLFQSSFNSQWQNERLAYYALNHRPYLFYVGGMEERKNLDLVIHALKRIENRSKLVLVLAGGVKSDWEKLQTIADQKNLGNRIRFLGRIPDSDLPALYSGAMAMVYPSYSEGFGLQLVEAMAVGCPVLASSATSLPEVLGQGGVLFSPENASELAGLIDRLEHEPVWRQELCQKALARGKQFDWKITAEKTLAAFLEVLRKS